MFLNTNQFKNGNHIEVEGTVFKILEFQHVKPGKGGAFVRTKLRRAADGAVIDRTFRAGEKFRPVRTEARKMQFLYADGTDAHFMDTETYEQIAIPEDGVGETLQWVQPNDEVDMLYIDEQPRDIQLASVGRARGHPDRARRARRHRVRRRQQAGDARDRRDRSRCPLFINIGDASRSTRAPASTCRACLSRGATDQRPGGGVRALPARGDRAPARRRLRAATQTFTRALAHAAADNAEELDEPSSATRRAGRWTASPR